MIWHPWILYGEKVYIGLADETQMQLAKRALGMNTQQVWALVPYQEFALGFFDVNSGNIQVGEQLTPQQENLVRQAFASWQF